MLVFLEILCYNYNSVLLQFDKCCLTQIKPKHNKEKLSKMYTSENNSPDRIVSEIRTQLPEIDVDKGLVICVGDNEFYIEMFTCFVNLPIKDELSSYLSADDYNNYCIRVHGFKNNAYSVGANALGDLAATMQNMSSKGLPEDIIEAQASLFEQYDKICDVFNKIISEDVNGK